MGKKVAIIVWKWKNLPHINEKIWGKKDFNKAIEELPSGKGVFYDEYSVEPSNLCPEALVVALAMYQVNEDTQRLLDALISQYAQDGNEVMLFLHRSNDYKQSDVDRLLTTFEDRLSKCFLFADGRDFIYYKTQKSGLLDDIGDFAVGRDRQNSEKVVVYDGQQVKQPYFDRFWQYYNIEFETKVFRFKQELFDQWMPFLLPTRPEAIPQETVLNALRAAGERALLQRAKSFVGWYEKKVSALHETDEYDQLSDLKKEQKTLENLEKKDRISYVFDDCIANLEHQKNNNRTFISEAYEEARDSLNKVLFDDRNSPLTKEELRILSDRLDYLVKIIPGEID